MPIAPRTLDAIQSRPGRPLGIASTTTTLFLPALPRWLCRFNRFTHSHVNFPGYRYLTQPYCYIRASPSSYSMEQEGPDLDVRPSGWSKITLTMPTTPNSSNRHSVLPTTVASTAISASKPVPVPTLPTSTMLESSSHMLLE